MKLGEFFKNYNIRVAYFYPIKHNLKIYNTDLNTKTIKNFLDLKKFFDQNNIVVRNFYISELGTIPLDLKINKINNFIEYSKKKSTINFKLKEAFKILNNNEYSDIDWYLRSMKKILLNIKENNFSELNNILQILKKDNLTVYKKTKILINNLRENNIILKEFKI
tara:strand:- start:128 stop:622 length:495 start_codon:yes stop_codon:yes gene_type:complete